MHHHLFNIRHNISYQNRYLRVIELKTVSSKTKIYNPNIYIIFLAHLTMALKETVFEQVIKKKGNFNFTETYTYMYNWLKDLGYLVKEKGYTEKSGEAGKEILILWEAEKKVTDYYKYIIRVEFFILTMTSVEIVRDGKKIKTNKGDLKLSIKAELVKDYEAQWEQTPFQKFMRGIYEKYIIRSANEEYKEELALEAVEVVSNIKAYLELF
ncbi:MAG: hypothetical protein ACI83O_000308 [Patescibacteria group bacterium]|jgi:hypothetical protein